MNDSLLLCNTTIEEGMTIKSILKSYNEAFGQSINISKFSIMFSLNMGGELRTLMSTYMLMNVVRNLGRYLVLGFMP